MTPLALDHLVISAGRLEDGVALAEDLFGVSMAAGGRHPLMGTHNRLLSLGPEVYLEVIAADPDAPDPGRARWYDLDRFTGAPRLTHWVLRCADLDDALSRAPTGTGTPMAVSRGDLTWTMAVPGDGILPLDGCAPALICWGDTAHPAARLPDKGCRLDALTVCHPDIARLETAYGAPAQVRFVAGAASLSAVFDTPRGRVALE